MTLDEARNACAEIWKSEKERPALIKLGEVCEVRAPNGVVLGRGFGWLNALRQAAKPMLDAAALNVVKAREAAEADAHLFHQFLMETLHADFVKWKLSRAAGEQAARPAPADQGSDPGGAQPDQEQLVQELPAEQPSPPRPLLVLAK